MVIERVVDAAIKFAQLEGGAIGYLKLIKYLYLLEREVISKYGYSISYDRFYSMKDGPVLSETLDIVRDTSWNKENKDYWDEHFEKENYFLKPKKESDFKNLSKKDLEIITNLFDQHKDKDRFELRDWVHENCPEWVETKSSIPLQLHRILLAAGKSKEEASEQVNDILQAEFLHNFK